MRLINTRMLILIAIVSAFLCGLSNDQLVASGASTLVAIFHGGLTAWVVFGRVKS